jgi:hypothetical protein
MASDQPGQRNEPKLREVLKQDFRQINFRKDFTKEYKDLDRFYLNDARRERLQKMPNFKRWFFRFWWLLRSMIFRLTPTRRLLVLLGIVLFWFTGTGGSENSTIIINNNGFLSCIIFLFVLLLELKDKLVMQDELEAGRKVQQSLMPAKQPAMAGWEIWLYTMPANEVGGDLIDYLRLDDESSVVTIADIAGKGLQAALLMTKLQATIRALAGKDGTLAEFAATFNRIFYRDSPANLFASTVYTMIQVNNGTVKYVNAGHFPPLLIKPDGIEVQPKGGPALGLMPKVQFTEQTIELQPGEMYLAYTDGIIEAKNDKGEFYGTERFLELLNVIKVLPLEEIGNRISGSVRWFANDAPMSDDLSVLILKKL